MAIVEMQKIRLVGLKNRQARIMDTLAVSGRFEAVATSELPYAGKDASTETLDKLLAKKARCAFAVDSVAEANSAALSARKKSKNKEFGQSAEKVTAKRFFTEKTELDEAAASAAEIFRKIDEIEKLVSARTANKARRAKLVAANKQLSPYLSCTDKFSSFRETDRAFSLLAGGKASPALLAALDGKAAIVDYGGGKKTTALLGIAALKKDREAVTAALSQYGFTVCPYSYELTARELIGKNIAELADARAEDMRLIEKLLAYNDALAEIKKLHDYYYIEADKAEAAINFGVTEQSFVAEGWVPKPEAEKISEELTAAGDGAVVTLLDDVKETDDPPTLYKSNRVLAPFQALTDQYSSPSYFEPDPNVFTAFFFFLFFGMMTADAGYGLVLAVGATLMIKLMKPEPGMKNLVLLIGICSLSAVIWGLLFGSVFGFDFGNSDFGFGLFGTAEGYTAGLWFNPLEEPLLLLLICLVLGAVHILVGYAIAMYKHFQRGRISDALFDDGFMILTYAGVILLLLAMGKVLFGLDTHTWGDGGEIPLWPAVFGDLLIPGLVVMGLGLVGTVCTKGRKKKGIAAKIITGLSGLYGIVNILSDVLSYARIFGIALASCAIGYAFNILIGMIGGAGGFMVVPAAILAVVLHAFNLAMGVLSAYVHNARLQYLEFYGKFYDGGGHAFRPLGNRTKYTRFA